MIRIRGEHLGPSQTANAQLDEAGRLPLVLGATRVLFGDYLAPLISIQDNLIVALAPFEISGATAVTVVVDGQSSNSVRIAAPSTDPQILAIANQDGSANSADHPAKQGSVITLWVTGLGQTAPLSADGMINPNPPPVPLAVVTAMIGNQQVKPQYVAAAVGLAAGIAQVNLQVPVASYPANPAGMSVNSGQGLLYIEQ